jgi:hypothetical protein
MSDTWDPFVYRQRAAAWRNRAIAMPEDTPKRSACVALAEDYDKLADLLEERALCCTSPPLIVTAGDC